jgi:hypothetical protein
VPAGRRSSIVSTLKAGSFWLLSALLTSLSLPAQAADKAASKPTDKAASKPTDKAAGEPTDKPAGEPTDKPDEPTNKPDEPTDEPDEPDEPADEAASKPANKPVDDNFGHGKQFGLRVGLVGGYNMVFRYDESPLCNAYDPAKAAKDQQKFCGHVAPLALDLAISFAPLDFVEPYVFTRLGLAGETQTDTLPVKIVGAGARIYTMSDSAFKIFIEPALALEFEGGAGKVSYPGYNPQYKNDLLIHLAAGPQIDVARYVGFYAHAGLTTGILRALHTQLELQAGVQARLP